MLPLRVLAVYFAIALGFLWRAGGSPGEVAALLGAMLPLEAGGPGALRVLLGRCASSFFLISFALVSGLSVALAVAMPVSRLGGRTSMIVGWIGRALTGVPPMAWALGAMVWLIQVRGLPVETLFPCKPPPEADRTALLVGRTLWSWLVPMLVLSLPVLGAGLFSTTHRLESLMRDPAVERLKARGLPQPHILYRHLVPLLRVHQVRLARPVAALLLACDIPVEELLGFDGWGRHAAELLLTPAASGRALAVMFWTGGLLFAAILGWLALLDRRGLPEALEEDSDPALQPGRRSAMSGAVLAVVLMLPPGWFLSGLAARNAGVAHLAWTGEVFRALGVSAAALLVAMAVSFLMSLVRPRILTRAWAVALAMTPLLVALLFFEKQNGRHGWCIVLAASIPGIAAFREALRDADKSDFMEAARALGQSRAGMWLHHMLPAARDLLPGLLLRNAGTVMIMFCVLDFYSIPSSNSWGGQMRLGAGHVLDDPFPALVPALLLALWSLSFRLLSRASVPGCRIPGVPTFER